MKLAVERLKEIESMLRQKWPDAFSRHQPLAKGCHAELLTALPEIPKQDLLRVLNAWTHHPTYLKEVMTKPFRIGLDGRTKDEIIEEDRSSGKKAFRFIKGPIFANIILADEINRTPPKTQAALLEAMQEHKVTSGGEDMRLDEPFFVLATQNTIEQEGTYPLPEAQLDRFMFNLWIDYPSFQEEMDIVKATTGNFRPELKKVMNAEQIIASQNVLRKIPVADNVIEYAVKLVNLTRPSYANAPEFVKKWINWGAGPRASQYLILGAKTRAALQGRYTPSEADVRACAIPVLRHRIVTNFNAEAEGVTTMDVVKKLFEHIK